jgi:hypothetical protein
MAADQSNQWEGPYPPKNTNCPYSIEFTAKPIPSTTLHSIEAGRVQFGVFLKDNSFSKGNVKEVRASLINHLKEQSINKLEGSTIESSHNNTTSITITLHQEKLYNDNNNNNVNNTKWLGEFSIPGTWLEGGTKTFQRSGSHAPPGEETAFSLQISYKLDDGKICTGVFNSADAFHWVV